MNPKEKAKELFDKYFLLNESATDENGVWIVLALNKGLAKKCALIAVDEILDFLIGSTTVIDYWKEVKQEINNL